MLLHISGCLRLNLLNTYARNKQINKNKKRKQEISTEASVSVHLILAKALSQQVMKGKKERQVMGKLKTKNMKYILVRSNWERSRGTEGEWHSCRSCLVDHANDENYPTGFILDKPLLAYEYFPPLIFSSLDSFRGISTAPPGVLSRSLFCFRT